MPGTEYDVTLSLCQLPGIRILFLFPWRVNSRLVAALNWLIADAGDVTHSHTTYAYVNIFANVILQHSRYLFS